MLKHWTLNSANLHNAVSLVVLNLDLKIIHISLVRKCYVLERNFIQIDSSSWYVIDKQDVWILALDLSHTEHRCSWRALGNSRWSSLWELWMSRTSRWKVTVEMCSASKPLQSKYYIARDIIYTQSFAYEAHFSISHCVHYWC